jgi:hypothetical protein
MTVALKAAASDRREDSLALFQWAIDMRRQLERGREIWNAIAKHSPDLQRPDFSAAHDLVEACVDASEKLTGTP